MKKLIIIALMLVSYAGFSQTGYTPINTTGYNWIRGLFRALGLPAQDSAYFTDSRQYRGAGAVIVDTTGDDKGVYLWIDTDWKRLAWADDAGNYVFTSPLVNNGDTISVAGLASVGISGQIPYSTGSAWKYIDLDSAVAAGGSVPTLQEVTDEGATTTNAITTGNITINTAASTTPGININYDSGESTPAMRMTEINTGKTTTIISNPGDDYELTLPAMTGVIALKAADSINTPQNIIWQDNDGFFHKAEVPASGGSSLFPLSGTGTATGNVTGDMDTHTWNVKSSYHPNGGIFYNGTSGLIRIGDWGPDHNETNIDISDSDSRIILNTSGTIRMRDSSIATASNGYVWKLIDATSGKGAWQASSGGSSYTKEQNPNKWTAIEYQNNPILTSADWGVAERSNYHPSPVWLPGSDTILLATKGDNCGCIRLQYSLDGGLSFDTLKTIIPYGAGVPGSQGNTFPLLVLNAAQDSLYVFFQSADATLSMNIGFAKAARSDLLTWTAKSSGYALQSAAFKTALGMTNNPGLLGVSSWNLVDDTVRVYGTYKTDGDKYQTWRGYVLQTSPDSIRSPRLLVSISYTDSLVMMPTVWKEDTAWRMIVTRSSRTGSEDTLLMNLRAYHSADGLTGWTPYDGILISPNRADSSKWDSKRIYYAQMLKTGDDWSTPFNYPIADSVFGYPYPTGRYWYALYISGSDTSTLGLPTDFSGLVYLVPDNDTTRAAVVQGENATPELINRNNTLTLSVPNADDEHTGWMTPALLDSIHAKAPFSGSTYYIQNKGYASPQSSSSFSVSDRSSIGGGLNINGTTVNSYALEINADGFASNAAGWRVYNATAGTSKYLYAQMNQSGEFTLGGVGTSGSFTLSSFASGILLGGIQDFRLREYQSPFNYPIDVDLTTNRRIYLGGAGTFKTVIGSYSNYGGVLSATSTASPQTQWYYDGSNHATITVGSTGITTLNATGSGASFVFSDPLTATSLTTADPGSGAGTWKLGTVQTATVVLDTTQYVEITIGGTTYKLALVNIP